MSFQFKQFSIHQQHCAQKVSEVACIQGAWTTLPSTSRKVLDIGSGTGLLSLMIAQRFDVDIDAIEIEKSCFEQGKENIENSPFRDRIHPIHGDITDHTFNHLYDFIITNPPFFEKQLMADEDQVNTAKHSTKLSLNELISSINRLLIQEGQFSILFPYDRKSELMMCCAKYDFFPIHSLCIKHSTLHQPKVMVVIYSKEKSSPIETDFIIKEHGKYTNEMKELMRAYYLNCDDK